MTTRTPAPVNVPVVPTTTGPLDRAPAPVSPATDPELPRTPVPVLRPSAVAPAAAPTPYRSTATATPVLPIEEAPVDLTPPVESEDQNIVPDTPRYVTVLEDSTVVVSEAAQLNFSGSGVSVVAQGSTANIVITGGSSSSYANANVAAFLAAYGSNTLVTTGNVTAGYLFGNGSQLTGIASTYGNANVAANLAAFGSNPITTTGNISGSFFIGNGSQLTGITASTGNLDISGTAIAIAAGAGETSIAIVPDGPVGAQAFIDVPNNATANTDNVRIYNSLGNVEIATDVGNNVWLFGSTGTLTVPGVITSSTEDTEITATDDVNIYGGDKTPSSDSGEGGDVNITGGQGRIDSGVGASSGGDVVIEGGLGGDSVDDSAGAGGGVTLQAGPGGDANTGNVINAGDGGSILIQGGDGGDNGGNLALNGAGGNVDIYGGSGSFDSANTRPDGAPGHVNLYGGNWGYNFAPTGNIYLNTYDGTNFKTLTFDYNGNLTMADGGQLRFAGGDGVMGRQGDDLVISWDNEDIVIKSISDDVRLEADDDVQIRAGYDSGYDTYLSQWEFTNSGQLSSLPIVDGNAFNDGHIQFVGNSSGDGNGYTTLRLVPDATLTSNDQYLILDPTSPGHIHLRAGGTQDNSSAMLFLGGENSHFKVNSGSNPSLEATANNYSWTFGTNGTFTLPPSTGASSSQVNSVGNSSGDGNGYTTLQLIPDETLTGNDQYLIVDPTAPGHIHIRAGGTQDNSSADLILGGENSFVKIAAGANSDVFLRSNSNDWRFNTNGVLTLPGEGVLQSVDDTVTLSSLNTSTGNANSVYLGSGGGLGFNDQAIGGNWLEIFRNGAEPEIRTSVGNLTIQTVNGPTSYNWTFDNTGVLTVPGNIVMAAGTSITGTGASPAPSISGFNSINSLTVSASGNITGGNILGNGASMTGVATKVTGSWNVTTGTATYSFTVPVSGVYQLWIEGNIANGIIVYNATVSVTNSNVPVIGQQFAWNYEGPGTPLLLTSIPSQIIGTAGAISNASPTVGTTTNTFDFGINNSSGANVTVNYGYAKLS